jgi:hypothetical protein
MRSRDASLGAGPRNYVAGVWPRVAASRKASQTPTSASMRPVMRVSKSRWSGADTVVSIRLKVRAYCTWALQIYCGYGIGNVKFLRFAPGPRRLKPAADRARMEVPSRAFSCIPSECKEPVRSGALTFIVSGTFFQPSSGGKPRATPNHPQVSVKNTKTPKNPLHQ